VVIKILWQEQYFCVVFVYSSPHAEHWPTDWRSISCKNWAVSRPPCLIRVWWASRETSKAPSSLKFP